jgi:RNA polymerase sigma-70 factor (ECF subfamily)
MERTPGTSLIFQTAFSMPRTRENQTAVEASEIAALVRRTVAGDPAAFEQIILRYERRVLTLAMRLLGPMDEAQDAAQEIFLRAFKYIHRLDPERPIEPWLIRITVNVCRDIGRKRLKRRITFCESTAPETASADQSADPCASIESEQERSMLQKALAGLPEKERMAVILRDVEGLSTAEVALVLHSSESTVRSQISRGRVRLKDAIDGMLGVRP